MGEIVKRKKLSTKIEELEKDILSSHEKLLYQFSTNQRRLLKIFKLYGFTNEEMKEIVYSLFLKRKEIYKNKDKTKYHSGDEGYTDGSLWGKMQKIKKFVKPIQMKIL